MENTGSTTRAEATDGCCQPLPSDRLTLHFATMKKGDPWVALSFYRLKPQAALNSLCGSMTNFFGTPASNSP